MNYQQRVNQERRVTQRWEALEGNTAMTTTTNKATIGSISSGTLRNEDLLQAFSSELHRHEPSHPNVVEAYTLLDNDIEEEIDSENTSWLINDLQDALNDYAPPFCYFGNTDDGADFGFWPDHDAIQDAMEGAEAQGENIFLNLYHGVIIQLSDHGNITITKLEFGETILEIV